MMSYEQQTRKLFRSMRMYTVRKVHYKTVLERKGFHSFLIAQNFFPLLQYMSFYPNELLLLSCGHLVRPNMIESVISVSV